LYICIVMSINNTYVYIHTRDDTGEIFYVGIGINNRAYNLDKRNRFWNRIIAKTTYTIKIVFNKLSHKEALHKEIRLIKLIGRSNLGTGSLCNLTNGGEGCLGYKATKETRDKLRSAGLLRKTSPETKQKLKNNAIKRGLSSDRLSKMYEGRKLKGGWETVASLKRTQVICNKTNRVFHSIKDAAQHLNVNKHSLAAMLRGVRKNKTSLRYK